MTEAKPPDTLALAHRIADLILEKRGADLVLLDVRELVDYTDYFLIATGQSGRQNQAIGEHVVKTLKADHRYAISKSGLDTGSWICLDLADVVVHVFDPETRARYDLELLWADAPRTDLGAPSAVPAAPAAPAAEEKPKRRKRATRVAAVEDADAENAPDSARPPIDEPEPEGADTVIVEEAPRRAKKAAAKSPAPMSPAPKRKVASKPIRTPLVKASTPKRTDKPSPRKSGRAGAKSGRTAKRMPQKKSPPAKRRGRS